jgi:hypothetical protein
VHGLLSSDWQQGDNQPPERACQQPKQLPGTLAAFGFADDPADYDVQNRANDENGDVD